MDKKYQVFISSTYKDLIEARQKVSDEILKSYNLPIGMELFSASNKSQWEIITKIIDNTDYYVLILGHRYGSLNEDGIGYTEMEYDYAKSLGIPILSFVRSEDVSTKPSERETDPELIKKLNAFRKKVTADKMCEFWKTEDELKSTVMGALYKEFYTSPRIGWIRGDKIKNTQKLEEKNLKLLEKITKLELQVEKSKMKDKDKRILKSGYSYKEIKKLLETKKITVEEGNLEFKEDKELLLINIFLAFKDRFATGISNASGMTKENNYVYFRLAPHFITLG
ncbi:MAG: DUF4062 domain-containing protein, partial [Psychrilyobacter sp.]|uniref:DUF4062 domain-containing protein n=1 Tax=Psychrilyobacter sp. TaxID=2586924 RepID=UPI003C70A0BE